MVEWPAAPSTRKSGVFFVLTVASTGSSGVEGEGDRCAEQDGKSRRDI
jgi:hypothetical protein